MNEQDDLPTAALARLELRLRAMFDAVAPGSDPAVRRSEHADLQADGALRLAKALGRSPREVAAAIAAQDELADVCSRVEISGPGFLNLTLADAFLGEAVAELAADERLGCAPAAAPERVVVDYSALNVAKEAHVGHLRSTIIGDAVARLLAFAGHEVLRHNHVGDWGTPLGMLIEQLLDDGAGGDPSALDAEQLTARYRAARVRFDADEAFRTRSRERVVALQSGDPETRRLWEALVASSADDFQSLYDALGVLLTKADVVGESVYDPLLPGLVEELDALGLLRESDGAKVVFPPGFAARDGSPLPLIVQKSDGGYTYATTDLAAVRDRIGRLGATRLVYVVGAPQSQHLAMVRTTCELAGWLRPPARCEHVAFGSVLGEDGKMLRTRAGATLRLRNLVEEAVRRGEQVVAAGSPDLPQDERAEIGRAVGVGALKFADLSNDRVGDYVFSWERMLALEGCTAPYLQYAHARIHSILRRAGAAPADVRDVRPALADPRERALALALMELPGAVADATERLAPHRLCTYLYELAQTFTVFYAGCPVLRADVAEDVRASRLQLCAVTARALATGLGLLGIAAPERM